MKKNGILVIVILWIIMSIPPPVHGQGDKELFEKAKVSLFNKKWEQGLKSLDTLIKNHPRSPYYTPALFYKARCHEELKQFKESLAHYDAYLEISRNRSLREEAHIAVINLCFVLYRQGDKDKLERITRFLKSPELTLRYYAAVKLSYLSDKGVAAAAVPVLKKMISGETDTELIDRAKIALMRIDPAHLKGISRSRDIQVTFLKIRVFDKKSRKETVSVNIPFALAKLALDALTDNEKALLKAEGYNLDRILETIVDTREVLKIEGEDDVIRIWVE